MTIPSSVVELEGYTGKIKNVYFEKPSSIKTIKSPSFQDNKYITQISIPSSVIEIGYLSFYKCTSLKTVTFEEPSSLEIIEENAFEFCKSLTKIVIPASVIHIKYHAFHECTSLRKAIISSKATNLHPNGFPSKTKIIQID